MSFRVSSVNSGHRTMTDADLGTTIALDRFGNGSTALATDLEPLNLVSNQSCGNVREEPTLTRLSEMLTMLSLTLASFGAIAPTKSAGQEVIQAKAPGDGTSVAPCSEEAAAFSGGSSEFRFQPLGLSMVRSHVVGKIPVVLVHGLWGSPRNWASMLQALEVNPVVRERFQFLTFGYSGGSSITYSAYQLRQELHSLRDQLDADHADLAWDRVIMVGHSLGGVLCKMMVQDSGSKLWDLISQRPFEKLGGPNDARDLLRSELVYKPVEEVQRLIFVATPHRGSHMVCGAIKEIGIRLTPPPARSWQAHAALLACNGADAFTPIFRAGQATSLEQLAWEHPLLLAIDSLPIDARVKRHSIIADQMGLPGQDKGDGLVSYASAHHVGATSELVVPAGHVCLESPEVIGEVARILKEHARP
jgi:pimeloyl-ACP methyl ester carboxylesterase